MQHDVLIVIPTYNEINNLKTLVSAIFESVSQGIDVLIVDDQSPDGTGQLADVLSQSDTRIHVLHRQKKMGLGTAYVHGFYWGLSRHYQKLIEMDADFSHDPKSIPALLAVLETYDVAIGSRYVAGGGVVNWTWWRRWLSRCGSAYARWILKAPIRDFTGGFNGWKRIVLETIDLDSLNSDGYAFQIEVKYRAFLKKFKIQEFPIIFMDRRVGDSKMSYQIILEALIKVVQFRWSLFQ